VRSRRYFLSEAVTDDPLVVNSAIRNMLSFFACGPDARPGHVHPPLRLDRSNKPDQRLRDLA
jgi:hypothetical protein